MVSNDSIKSQGYLNRKLQVSMIKQRMNRNPQLHITLLSTTQQKSTTQQCIHYCFKLKMALVP